VVLNRAQAGSAAIAQQPARREVRIRMG
jgi:hypothetical protein